MIDTALLAKASSFASICSRRSARIFPFPSQRKFSALFLEQGQIFSIRFRKFIGFQPFAPLRIDLLCFFIELFALCNPLFMLGLLLAHGLPFP